MQIDKFLEALYLGIDVLLDKAIFLSIWLLQALMRAYNKYEISSESLLEITSEYICIVRSNKEQWKVHLHL